MIKKILFLSALVMAMMSCDDAVKKVQVQTEYGNMTFELYNSTPAHRDNFVKLVKEGYYNDLLFHRVIKGFMIQGGDPNSKGAGPNVPLGQGGPGYTLPAEIAAPHFKGTLAGARQGDAVNPQKESSGSQFYISQGRTYGADELNRMGQSKGIQYSEAQIAKYQEVGGVPFLDMEYTVFGEIVDGMEVIDKIANVQTGQADRPVKDMKMKVVMLN